jgi:hypothetical protein
MSTSLMYAENLISVKEKKFNYVAYGNSLSVNYNNQEEYYNIISQALPCNRYIKSVFEYYAGRKQRENIVTNTLCMDRYFRSMKIKPFSCVFKNFDNLVAIHQAGSHINLRLALFYNLSLYYPPQVRDELLRLEFLKNFTFKRHIDSCIGWLLGYEASELEGMHWYITNIQTDIKGRYIPSILREYFRDWHNIILLLTINEAIHRGVNRISIVGASTLTHFFLQDRKGIPISWERYYDRNAQKFGFLPVTYIDPINISIYPWYINNPKYGRFFYTADVQTLSQLLKNDVYSLLKF